MKPKRTVDRRTAALLLRSAGLVLLLSSLLVSPWLVAEFDPAPPIEAVTAVALSLAQRRLLLIGVCVLAFAEFIVPAAGSRLLGRLFDRPIATKVLASILVVLIPFTIAEILLQPFTVARSRRKSSSSVLKDRDLGSRIAGKREGHSAGNEQRGE
ncbi:hypothetical protein ACFLSJ_02135 [Verrucomicrobiota bacterium]